MSLIPAPRILVVVIVNRGEAGCIMGLTGHGNAKGRSCNAVDRKLPNEMAVLREFYDFARQLVRGGRRGLTFIASPLLVSKFPFGVSASDKGPCK